MQEHVLDVPRLQRVHEGQGPARRALHHQPHLRHLRRQPRRVLAVRAEHGVRREDAAAGRVDREPRRGRGVHLRPHDLPGQPGVRGLLRADGQGHQPERAREGREGRGPARRGARLPHDRRHHALVQPVHGRDVPRGARDEPDHEGDDLPDGGAPRAPLDDLSGRGGHGRDADAVHRLPDPPDSDARLHQEGRSDERRRVRLLLRGPAGLRGGRPAPRAARVLGRVQQPRARGLRLPQHGRLGQRDVRDPRRGGGRRARDHEPRGHQPGHPDPARELLLRGLGERGDLRREGPAREPGRQAPPLEPDDDPQAAEARSRGRQLLVGDEPTLVRRAQRRPPGARHRRRRPGAAVGDGAREQGRHAVREGHGRRGGHHAAADPGHARRPSSSGGSRSGRTRSSATGRGSTSSPTPRRWRSTSWTRASPRCVRE